MKEKKFPSHFQKYFNSQVYLLLSKELLVDRFDL